MGKLVGSQKSSDELHQAYTLLQNHALNFIDSMCLKCALDLGIADAVHRHGGPITLPDLLSALAMPRSRAPHLRRLMRILTNSGYFLQLNSEDEGGTSTYSLTPVSRLLIRDNEQACLCPLVALGLHPVTVNPFHHMSSWLRGADDEQTPFSIAHGCGLWEKTNCDPEYNQVFNEAMASDAQHAIDVLLKECGHLFEGLTTLVDVGGGTGMAAKAIAEAFPKIKCSVLDLPQVIDAITAEEKGGPVDFVVGDMFACVPRANAVLLKWILHDWSDEECVKILRRCKEAIPSKEEGGKVIVIDMVVSSSDGHNDSGKTTRATQLYADMLMMVLFCGAEREEEEWRKLFVDAGFSSYKIVASLGVRSVIELYP